MRYTLLYLILSIFLAGCGGEETKSAATAKEKRTDTRSKSAFGYLANATVHIYDLTEGKKTLLFTEKTSSGKSLDEIGNFKDHVKDFHPKKFYQLEVSGGENWDSDKDGILDHTASKNRYTYRTIYKGHKPHISWWKSPGRNSNGLSEKE